MTRLTLVALLAVGWVAVTGGLSLANLLLGAIVASLVVLLVLRRSADQTFGLRLWHGLGLAGIFVLELVAGALAVAVLAITPNLRRRLRPAILAMPLAAHTDAQITVLANLITLTPGTLSLDVSPDRKLLYIHVLDVRDRDALLRGISKGFEQRVIEVLR